MIGDWVQIIPDTIAAYGLEIPEKAVKHQVDCYDMRSFAEGGLEPIELTTEILKKNDFHFINGAIPYWYNETVDVIVFKELGTSAFKTKVLSRYTTIRYVHELQHLLRCSGLNDFANNFELS